jgi:hypothetical protein
VSIQSRSCGEDNIAPLRLAGRSRLLDRERQRTGDDVGGHMGVGGEVARNQSCAARDAPLGVHPATTAVAAKEATPAATANPPTGSIWTMPLLVVVAPG